MCRFLTSSLIIVRVSHCHHNRPDEIWGNIAEQYKLTIVLELRQQVEAIELDRLPRWLLFHLPLLRPGQIAVLLLRHSVANRCHRDMT